MPGRGQSTWWTVKDKRLKEKQDMKHNNQAMLGIVLAASLLQFAVFAEDNNASTQKPPPSKLPNVLIIGDSISMGYTDGVRKLLEGKANVSRPPCNCAYSGNGVNNVQSWLGTTKWDVVHFNFGIWNTHCLYRGKLVLDRSKYKPEDLKRRYTTEQHVENLSKIVAVLKKTGAKLIWASTTPFVSYGEDTKLLVVKNNKAAKELMDKQGITVNDLYSLALPHLKEWQSADGCHFATYEPLAKQVATTVADALGRQSKELRPAAESN